MGLIIETLICKDAGLERLHSNREAMAIFFKGWAITLEADNPAKSARFSICRCLCFEVHVLDKPGVAERRYSSAAVPDGTLELFVF